MFQTEPILALQRNGWLHFPMWLTSELGYTHAFIVVVLAIIYMVDFRKGFVIVQVIAWNGIFTDVFKGLFALPRPDAVDSRVLLGGVEANPVPFEGMGAGGFLEPLPADVVSRYRSLGEFSFGFPSGHCSATTSTWATIALLFKRPDVRLISAVLILLMPVSRMYLGRHFLADVLGGVALGLLATTIGWLVIARSFDGRRSLNDWTRSLAPRREQLVRILYFFGLPLAAMALPHADFGDCARLLGINLAWTLVRRTGLPASGGPPLRRLARLGLAALSFLLVGFAASWLGTIAGFDDEQAEAAAYFAATLATLWGTTELTIRMGLFPGRAG